MTDTDESQPWDDEPEIEADGDGTPDVDEIGFAGGMLAVAGLLSIIVLVWAAFGTVPNSVLFIFGLWMMAGTAVRIAEVYGS